MATIVIGADSYTAYASVADADVFFNGSVDYATWGALTTDEKSRSLVTSTRMLDRQLWQGEKEDPLQALAFPRTGVFDCAGVAVEPADTLVVVTEASIILALAVFTNNALLTTASTIDLTKRLKAGSVEIEKFRASSDEIAAGRFPLDVMELVGCYFSGRSSISGALSFGTDGTAFDADFGLSEGF